MGGEILWIVIWLRFLTIFYRKKKNFVGCVVVLMKSLGTMVQVGQSVEDAQNFTIYRFSPTYPINNPSEKHKGPQEIFLGDSY
ncbi:MAG TPA: hypothetical protein DCS08_04900 [Candidatus Moranbacteria bacterium]|nr:hypothetical protein [Candidatus Moranbacteria bacterium]